ncbi:MAG TPA: hydantoinase/oxoprolinase family protein [Solirubrobacteraceae bacterium]|jgi:N-methylhydantoinase A/acetone carboxylase beta subunit|nr:hydantoinase/oxoprolinase family protein [Solirubrobacteraceae bacterium]
MSRTPRVLAIDAGGTMTDTFIVDEDGHFVVGKAQTTPEDESVGLMQSADDAMRQWEMTVAGTFPGIRSGVFSGTAMLNRLLQRQGLNLGVIVTAGQEDSLQMERGIQTYLGYSYADRLHIATHHHNPPLVPRHQVHGVRGRIDLFGNEALPLRERDVYDAATALLDSGVQGICVCLLFSYRNPMHEARVKEILLEVKGQRGTNGDCPLFVSSELYPSRRDFPRLNTTVIEGYAAEPSRRTLSAVRDRTKEAGAGFELRVMASHGGTISIDADQLATTLVSGPIGGVVGGRWLADEIDLRNVLCTDIGGTSFDIALLVNRKYDVISTPNVAKFMLNMPLVQMDSVGAGCGSYVRIDPSARRPEIGPDSAGASIGTAWVEGGIQTVTITDLNLILGRLNPDYFLGGQVALDVERARAEVKRQVADPLRLELEQAAAGVVELFESQLRNEAVGRILGKGYSPADFTLLCYGGGGPLHVGGYTAGVPYQQVLIPEWAAGFSAFGCACADFEYRFDRQVDLPLLPTQSDEERAQMVALVSQTWRALEERVRAEFAKGGGDPGEITFTHMVRMQYYGQLVDIEVDSPAPDLSTAADAQALCDTFESTYQRMYARASSSPELGYLVAQAIVKGSVPIEKPRLPTLPTAEGTPPNKETRPVWWTDAWVDTPIYEMTDVRPGHRLDGPAILEAESTTFPIPPDRKAWLDEHGIFHLENKEA